MKNLKFFGKEHLKLVIQFPTFTKVMSYKLAAPVWTLFGENKMERWRKQPKISSYKFLCESCKSSYITQPS